MSSLRFSDELALASQKKLFEVALRIVTMKRADYCGSGGPFSNFQAAREAGVEPWRGAAVRQMDKFRRFVNLAAQGGRGEVKGEGILDTVVDELNYVVLKFLLWLEEQPVDTALDILRLLDLDSSSAYCVEDEEGGF